MRRLAKGHDRIEARLDLHGLTQAEAHAALVGFIHRCHAAGHRMVLVITGKGGPNDAPAQAELHLAPRPRGVLRRNLPRWLAEPGLSALVLNYAPAHTRHGGEGALYVTLRNAKPREISSA